MRPTLAAMLATAALAAWSPAQTGTLRPASQNAGREIAVPFRVGETLIFDVAYSTYLVAGTATSTVVEKRSPEQAYYIVAEGRPLPLIARMFALYYKMDTLLDSVTGLSQRTSLYTEEGSRRRTAITRFDRGARKALYELQATEGAVKDELAAPADVQDGLAMLYALRTRTFKPGERFTIPVADDGVLFSVEVEPTGPERLTTALGELEAWNLKITITDGKGAPAAKNMAVWLSTDARRLPLKLQADLPVGSFALTLKAVR
ncbi:MAG: DUF3108 domain-containing protein [Luteitalea sp.]|nr:DUF3108 domain-containing protein [Luteitalea sp.]